MAGPMKRKDGAADSGKNNERRREKGKKERVWRKRKVYNWCSERDIFMLHWFRDLKGNMVSFPPCQTRMLL